MLNDGIGSNGMLLSPEEHRKLEERRTRWSTRCVSEVPVTSLDYLLRDQMQFPISVMKIDIEGHELQAFKVMFVHGRDFVVRALKYT